MEVEVFTDEKEHFKDQQERNGEKKIACAYKKLLKEQPSLS